MKHPRYLSEFDCDGIACHRTVQVETQLPGSRVEAQRRAEEAGCRFLGLTTFFCPVCTEQQRRGFVGRPMVDGKAGQ